MLNTEQIAVQEKLNNAEEGKPRSREGATNCTRKRCPPGVSQERLTQRQESWSASVSGTEELRGAHQLASTIPRQCGNCPGVF